MKLRRELILKKTMKSQSQNQMMKVDTPKGRINYE